MAKEQPDQTVEPDDNAVEDAPDAKADAAAVKTSKDFDAKIDAEGVEDAGDDDLVPAKDKPGDDDSADKKDADDTDDSKPEGDDKDSADDKDDDQTPAADDDKSKESESKVSDEFRQKGRDVGMTDEEIDEFPDDESIERTIRIFENVIRDDSSEGDVKPGQAQTPAADASKSPEKGDDKTPGFDLKFKNEDEIDPEILANMKAMDEHYKGQIQALSERVEGLLGQLQQQQVEKFMGRFDEHIEKLGSEFTDVFGKGKTLDLSTRSLGRRNRDTLRKRMYAFAKGLADAGETVPSEDQLFDTALNSLHGKKVMAVQGLRSQKAMKKRGSQRLGRAATKPTGKATPDERAIETSKKFDDLIDTSED